MAKYRKNVDFLRILSLTSLVAALLIACSFDYNSVAEPDKTKPDIVMENLEYVRVRGGDPLVRFRAEYAERWEESQTMALRNFTFEQMEDSGETVNAEGRAATASVQLSSGDVDLGGGVRISVESEDITIRTAILQWKDKEKTLTGGTENQVDIERSDGTSFTGRGFFADARNWTWNFAGEVKGTYVEDDEESPEDLESGEEKAPAKTDIFAEEEGLAGTNEFTQYGKSAETEKTGDETALPAKTRQEK